MELELEQMLMPIAGENPAGVNEEYNPLYLQLEELAVGKAASTMGDSVIEGIDPDWRKLQKNCVELWKTTRDLRVAMYLCIAGFSLDGLKGFSVGLELIQFLVRELWQDFYPQLDPDDDNDPTERLNIFAMISPAAGSFSDPLMFINKFRSVRLTEGRKYTLRDLMIVEGELEGHEDKPDPLLFKGEMGAVPPNVIQESAALTAKIIEQLNDIAGMVDQRLPDTSVSFATLLAELKTLTRFYKNYTVKAEAEEKSGNSEEEEPVKSAAATLQRQIVFDLSSYVPANRAEALMMLQKGAAYFQDSEPSSPVPFLVNRAIRMSGMSFLELLGDIEPNALEKGREIFGIRPDQENN